MYLDPIYGRSNHDTVAPCEEGVAAAFACYRCGLDLSLPTQRCQRCSGPTFAVQTPEEGYVEWCSRNGCHWARWAAREKEGEQPVVEIITQDNGRGISDSDLPHLFEPFFSTKGARGTGLGLAVSWGIVEAHGGTIEVSSKVGEGSCFTIRLPLEPLATETQPNQEEERSL